MDASINFYELKQELGDLGFHDAALANELRTAIAADELERHLYTELPAGTEQAEFALAYQRDREGRFSLYCIECSMDNPGCPGTQWFHNFLPDVPAAEAIELVRLQRDYRDDDPFRPLSRQETQELITKLKTTKMNTENLDYLKESLKYSGFDTQLNAELEKNIAAQSPDFQLKHATKIGDDEMAYALHFRKGDQNEMYFFNRIDATLKKPGENEQGISQTFYANQHISAKEAYNLLDGRAVQTKLSYKDDIKKTYEAWVQLDFSKKDKHDNYEVERFTEKHGFRVEDKVKELSLAENGDDKTNERLVKSLKRGNLTEANWEHNGISEKVFLAANPKDWDLNVYDANMNALKFNELKPDKKIKQGGTAEDVSADTKKNQRQEQKNEDNTKNPSRKIKA